MISSRYFQSYIWPILIVGYLTIKSNNPIPYNGNNNPFQHNGNNSPFYFKHFISTIPFQSFHRCLYIDFIYYTSRISIFMKTFRFPLSKNLAFLWKIRISISISFNNLRIFLPIFHFHSIYFIE